MPDAPLPPLPSAGQPQWLTWFHEVRRRFPVRPAAVLVASLGLALVAAGVLLLRPATPVSVATLPAAVPAPGEPADRQEPAGRADARGDDQVVVDVAGAVARPGLVRLRSGDRVADAISAAGGVAADAEVAGVNQARVVADGEQVRVPRVGEPPPPSPAAGGSTATAGGPAAPVDLNRASATELDVLPGVGPATAAAIITWRDENGRFRTVEDLLEVPGIGPTRLERLRPLVRV